MKGKRVLSVLLMFVILWSGVPATADASIFDGSQSSWAEKEIVEAFNAELTYPALLNHYKQAITREEFCTIVVKLYEKLSGKTALVGNNPFKDTQNPEIVKAFTLGIVNGTSATLFSPYAQITRQEICVMLYRALSASGLKLEQPAGSFPFADESSIASWANEAVKFAYENNMMKGLSATIIGPKENTTREQGIVLLKRTYNSFSGVEPKVGTIPFDLGRKPLSEKEKIIAFDGKTSPIFNTITPSATLYVATSEAKPTFLPLSYDSIKKNSQSFVFAFADSRLRTSFIDQLRPIVPIRPVISVLPVFNIRNIGNFYTDASFSTFIDTSSTTSRWFSYKLQAGVKPTKLVYQVSNIPFAAMESDWKRPIGLVSTGEISASQKEFQIDFNKLNIALAAPKPIHQEQKVYYVRIVPVNGRGIAIGEPGQGLSILVGKSLAEVKATGPAPVDFQLWTPQGYSINDSTEFKDYHKYTTETGYSPLETNQSRAFYFHNLPDGVNHIIIQVATEAFGSTNGDWTTETNIIYEKSYTLPVSNTGVPFAFQPTVFVPFSDFGKKTSEMTADQYTQYYIRGLAIVASDEPGKEKALFSQEIKVKYGFGQPITWFSDSPYTKSQKINRAIPAIKMISYEPIRWQDPAMYEYYQVFVLPKASEITCRYKNQNNETLYPYSGGYVMYYKTLGIDSAAEYETEVIPKFLSIGTKVHFPKPVEEDEEWYEQLYNGIVSFFEDLIYIASEITNQAKQAYADLRLKVIKTMVSLCPIDVLKSKFELAVTLMIDSGMMTMGLPPELPSFSELVKGNLEYLASVALTEAGIPADAMIDDLVDKLTDEMTKDVVEMGKRSDSNPIMAPFLKLHPDYLYRPASVELEVTNPTSYASVPGEIALNVTFEINYYNYQSGANGLNLVTDGRYGLGSSASWSIYSDYYTHFIHGLNGDTVDYTQGVDAVYHVYHPVVSQKIPILPPGGKQKIILYLTPLEVGSLPRYPEGEGVYGLDFYNMYYSNGNKNYTYFTLSGQFPDPREYMQSTGVLYLDPKTEYYFAKGGGVYQSIQKSVLYRWANQ